MRYLVYKLDDPDEGHEMKRAGLLELGPPRAFPLPYAPRKKNGEGVLKIKIERNYLVYFELFGEGVDEEPKGVLSIDKESGTLYVHRAVDYEEKTVLKVRLKT